MIKLYNSINSKWKKIIDKSIVLQIFPKSLILFVMFFLLISISVITCIKSNYKVLYSQDSADSIVGPLLIEPYKFDLNNVQTSDNPNKICIKYATYKRKNNAFYKYVVYKEDVEIYSQDFSVKKYKDGKYYCYDISMVDFNDKEKYSIEIKPIYANDLNTITIFKDSETSNPTIRLIKTSSIFSFKMIVLFIVLLIFFILNFIINIKSLNHSIFWLMLVPYLIIACLIIPPLEVPDEATHFQSVYNYSQAIDNPDDYMLMSPENIYCITYSHPEEQDKVNNSDDVKDCFKSTNNKYNFFKDIRKLQPHGYIFSILGILIVDWFTNIPILIFYSGRIANLIASIILIYIAIKKAPKYKNYILLVATIPMFIQQMVSYSYDSVLNSCCLLACSLILLFMYKKQVKLNILLSSIMLLLIIIFGVKMIYIPIIFIILMDDSILKRKDKLIYILLLLVGSFAAYKLLGIFINTGGDIVDVSNENYMSFKSNPLSIIPIAINTIKKNGWFYIEGLFGYFSWFRYKYPYYMFILYLIIIVRFVISDENKSSIKSRIIPLLLLTLSICAIFGAMYFSWSDPGLNYIDGVQGRYFIPLLLPIMILFTPKNKKIGICDSDVFTMINILTVYFILFTLCSYY